MDADDALTTERRHAAIRVQIMRNIGELARPEDEYLLRDPHEHTVGHCCPLDAHDHHTSPHRYCRRY